MTLGAGVASLTSDTLSRSQRDGFISTKKNGFLGANVVGKPLVLHWTSHFLTMSHDMKLPCGKHSSWYPDILTNSKNAMLVVMEPTRKAPWHHHHWHSLN